MLIFGMRRLSVMWRDLENTIELRDNGWTVLRFWESDIKKNLNRCVERVLLEMGHLRNNVKSY